MSEDLTPQEEPLDEQTRESFERTQKKLINQIESSLDNDGKKLVRIDCKACGTRNEREIEIIDIEARIKGLGAVSSALERTRKAETTSDTSVDAMKLLRDRSELSDAQLAEAIVTLEKELDGD